MAKRIWWFVLLLGPCFLETAGKVNGAFPSSRYQVSTQELKIISFTKFFLAGRNAIRTPKPYRKLQLTPIKENAVIQNYQQKFEKKPSMKQQHIAKDY